MSEPQQRNPYESKEITIFQQIATKIKDHNNIIIHTHVSPDFDALASILMSVSICKILNPQASINIDENTLIQIRLLYGKKICCLIDELINGNNSTNTQNNQPNHPVPSNTLNIVVDTNPNRVASNKQLLPKQKDDQCAECIVIDHHVNDYPHSSEDQNNNIYYIRPAPSNSVLMYKIWQEIAKNPENNPRQDELMLRLAILGIIGDNASKSLEELKTLIMQDNNISGCPVNDDEISSLLRSLNPDLQDRLKGIDQVNNLIDIEAQKVRLIYISVTDENNNKPDHICQGRGTVSYIKSEAIKAAIKKMGDVIKSVLKIANQMHITNSTIRETRRADYDILLLIDSANLGIVKIFNHGKTDWVSWLKSKTNNQSGGHQNDAAWTIEHPQNNQDWSAFRKYIRDLHNQHTHIQLLMSETFNWFYKVIREQRNALKRFLFKE